MIHIDSMPFTLKTMILTINQMMIFYSSNSFYKVYLTALKNSKLKWSREHTVLMYSTAYNL